jgi:hypothetical protein
MGAAAAVVLLRERQVVEAFERAGATSADRARDPADIGVEQSGVGWRRLRSRAVVRETTPDSGKFYVDLEVWQAVRRTRRRMLAVLVLVLVALVLFFVGIRPWLQQPSIDVPAASRP